MTAAWIGCMSWAIGVPEIVEAFRAETGLRWSPGVTGIERMIDEATGMDRAFIESFIRWANVEVWGPIDGGESAKALQDDPVEPTKEQR
jgi:hypothetical protein